MLMPAAAERQRGGGQCAGLGVRHRGGYDNSMVEIAEIQDRESFRAWLEETQQPREVCVALAAMRVLPVVWEDALRRGRYSAMAFLRASLIAGVAGLSPPGVLTGREHASAVRAAAADDAVWTALRSDCAELVGGGALHTQPLFGAEPSGRIGDRFESIRAEARSPSAADWSFWLDWYMRMLEGRQQNWPLLLEIAIQEDDFWQGSDAGVNARIANLVEKYAIAASEVGESIQLTQIDGEDRFESVPKSDLPADMFTDAIERTRDAVEEVRAATVHDSC